MREWWRFVKASFRRGWDWLVRVGSHTGAAFTVLGVGGFTYLSWATSNWWFTAFYVLSVAFLCFTVGAYEEYRAAHTLTGEALGISLLASLNLLRTKREQANRWLGEIRNDPNANVSAYDTNFSVIWSAQVLEIVQARFPFLVPKLQNEADEPLLVASTERERVFNAIQLGVKKLDAAIEEIDSVYQGVLRQIPPKK
jgi:hypothetical protein